mgnify:CR=1 FL=1
MQYQKEASIVSYGKQAFFLRISKILAITFHKNGQITVNDNHEEQGLIINSKNKVTINGNGRYAIAAFDVQKKLSPVTSYDADRAKILKKLGR